MVRITELTYYPVKGCAGVPAQEATLTEAGLAHDRTFMIVDGDGVFRSQRGEPRLALVRAEVTQDGARLTLRAPGREAVEVEVDTAGPPRDVTMFHRPLTGVDQGEEAAGWLSELLGAPSRLVRVPPGHDRVTTGHTPGTAGYADSTAVLLASRPSLDALNDRLAERESGPLPMDRFRANIVVDGWDEPYAEDRLRQVTVGDARLGYAKPAIRCAVTTIDQATGVKSGPEPLRTLAGYRRAAAGGVAFGVRFAVLRPGKLSVGDEVTVDAWGDSEL
jgi:MOSC domain-containing protein